MCKILQTTQIFKLTSQSPDFAYTWVLFEKDGAPFKAKCLKRGSVDMDNLVDIQRIPLDSFCPTIRPECSIATSPETSYAKTPNLIAFDGGNDLAKLVLQELATCEIIRKRPHRNLADFHGCKVLNDRIVGLCFKRYATSLQDKLNPQSLNKSAFMLSQEHAQSRRQACRYLPQIEEGIKYLHQLDLIHNDINPANIMLNDNDTPIIIDFESSRKPGMELGRAKRTYGWYDPGVNLAQESNDLDALAELRVWLSGISPHEYRFGQF
ncbi:hypothetical protein IQ07DRAFT_679653 [Pyrenochaeta sp. DS3sAY3a]|nr:hypothetical protein IQ07DRAFT_679653 [Pyrenochaeta sp. DS3sAY3a]